MNVCCLAMLDVLFCSPTTFVCGNFAFVLGGTTGFLPDTWWSCVNPVVRFWFALMSGTASSSRWFPVACFGPFLTVPGSCLTVWGCWVSGLGLYIDIGGCMLLGAWHLCCTAWLAYTQCIFRLCLLRRSQLLKVVICSHAIFGASLCFCRWFGLI